MDAKNLRPKNQGQAFFMYLTALQGKTTLDDSEYENFKKIKSIKEMVNNESEVKGRSTKDALYKAAKKVFDEGGK